MNRLLIIAAICLVPLLGTECSESEAQDQMAAWQTLGTLMEQSIADTEMQLHRVTDPIARAGIQARLDKMKEVSQGFNGALGTLTVVPDPAPGDAGASVLEAALVATAGLTGGVSLLGVPLVRLFRQRKQIFKAVDAGGGVVDSAAAKLKLVENQAAWKALQKHQNGARSAGIASPAPAPVG